MDYYEYDQDGVFLRPVVGETGEQPPNTTTTPPPQPCWRPVISDPYAPDSGWTETATDEEKNSPIPPILPTMEERVRDLEDAMLSTLEG